MRLRTRYGLAAAGALLTACTSADPSAGPSSTAGPSPAESSPAPAQSRASPTRPQGTPPDEEVAPSPRSPVGTERTNRTTRPRIRVTVVGDIMLGRAVGAAAAAAGDVSAPVRPMQRRLARADITVGNLENSLSRDGVPQQGGDSFGAPSGVLAGLADAGFDVLSLANNHTGDYGRRALLQTLRLLDRSPVQRVGAGLTRDEAWRPVVLERDGVRFGFVAFNAIGETPRATATSPGAAEIRMQPRTGPLHRPDLRKARRVIRALRRDGVDVVVVLPHWGAQYTHSPVPAQRRVGRALVDAGADVVVGGHPHWVQRVQRYHGTLVVHSLGNFVFDMDLMRQTREGVVADLRFVGDDLRSVRFTPYVIGADFAPRVVRGPRARTVLRPLGVPMTVRLPADG